MKNYIVEITLFVCGAVVMIFELAASRILAPFVGSSIYVWTTIIGVILASLSIGYWQGGRFADKDLRADLLAELVLFSAFFIAVTSFFKESFLGLIVGVIKDLRFASLLSSLVLFAPASALMGAVTPYATRLKMKSLKNSGTVVGRLYAISTLGSILGTFLGGFFLIGFLGSSAILAFLALTLLVLATAIGISDFRDKKTLFLMIFGVFLSVGSLAIRNPLVLLDTDSNYSRIIVYETIYEKNKRPIRVLSTFRLQQSAMYLDGEDLVFDYSKAFLLFTRFKKDVRRVLLIGGGGYSIPKYLLANFPGVEIDVVELDPKMTEIAKKYFGLKEIPRLRIYHTDGRSFINSSREKYDVMLIDAYKSDVAMPFELVTLEALQKYHKMLNDDGLVAFNLISSFEGEKSVFLRVVLGGVRRVFPKTFVLKPTQATAGDDIQNVVIFALKKDMLTRSEVEDTLRSEAIRLWQGDLGTERPPLTDDFAPVERYTLSLNYK